MVCRLWSKIGIGVVHGSPGFSGSPLQGCGEIRFCVLSLDELGFGLVHVRVLAGIVRGVPIPQQGYEKAQQACGVERGLPAIVHHDPGGQGRRQRRPHSDAPNGDPDA